MRRRAAPLIVLLLLASGAGGVAEAKKTRLIEPNCAQSIGSTITKRGNYLLKHAVQGCNSGVIISVDASHVSLDLGGRRIEGGGACLNAISVASGRRDVTVKNGTIRGCAVGVHSRGKTRISGVIAYDQAANGFDAQGDRLKNNIATLSNYGMRVNRKGVASKNVLVRNTSVGLHGYPGSTLDRNVVASNGSYGVFAGGKARRNAVIGNTDDGISAGVGARIERNAIKGNGDAGLELEDGLVERNRIVGNGAAGINGTAGGSKLFKNVLDGNGGSGITEATTGNVIERNTARGNLNDGISSTAGNRIYKNVVHGNLDYGVEAAGTPSGGKNKAVDNTGNIPGQCAPNALCVPDVGSGGTPVTISCPVGLTINVPGTYRLQRSVLNCNAGNAIFINSSDVTLDLQGRRIDGVDGLQAGITVANGLTNVKIRNGTVSDFLVGISVEGTDTEVRNVVVTSNWAVGVGASDGARVTASTLTFNGSGGSGSAIQADGDATIDRNTIASNVGGIDETSTGGSTITANLIVGNDELAIKGVDNNVISSNRIIGNGGGVLLGVGNTVSNNLIAATSGVGLQAGANLVATGNTVRGNSDLGMAGGAGSLISSNNVNGNGGKGIVSNGADIRLNTVRGNTDDGIDAGTSSVVFRNASDGNDGDGIVAVTPLAASGGNAARHNTGVPCTPADIC